jgi:hypothetical protein
MNSIILRLRSIIENMNHRMEYTEVITDESWGMWDSDRELF